MLENIKKLFTPIGKRLKNKKSFDRVWPFLLCILLSFVVWFYVMYIQAPEYEYTYEDVPVTVKNIPPIFADYKVQIYETEITATLRGTNMNIAKCSSEGIKAVLDLSSVSAAGLTNVPVTFEFPSGVTLTPVESISVWVNISAPQSRYFKGIPVVVEKDGRRGITEIGDYVLSAVPETVEAYLTSSDDRFASLDSGSVIAVADISDIIISAPGTYSSIRLKFISDTGVLLNDPNIYIEIIAEKKDN